MSDDDRSHAGYRVIGLVLFLGCAAVWPSRAEPERSTEVAPRSTHIDVQAPGAFDRDGTSPSTACHVRYRVHATVLLPLFSVPLAHRHDIGFASAAVQDYSTESEHGLRTYELFSASFPGRTRGLNRMGFIREVVGLGPTGARWTAHFGVLSSNPETSRNEVALDGDESSQSYTVMDGFTDRTHSQSTETYVKLRGSWLSAELFYRTLLPVWRTTEPKRKRGSLNSVPTALTWSRLGFSRSYSEVSEWRLVISRGPRRHGESDTLSRTAVR